MLHDTIKRRTKKCEGCGNLFVVNQKKALRKGRFCSHKCFLKTRPSSFMAKIAHDRAKHGMYATRIYRIWGAMKQRCLNPNTPAFVRYGGAGITVTPSWYSFEGFYKDMGDTYFDGATIDRIDGTKGYCKENCRWATRREQSSNLKNNVFVDCEGEVLCASECARKLKVDPSTIHARIYKGKMKQVWKRAQ